MRAHVQPRHVQSQRPTSVQYRCTHTHGNKNRVVLEFTNLHTRMYAYEQPPTSSGLQYFNRDQTAVATHMPLVCSLYLYESYMYLLLPVVFAENFLVFFGIL